MDRRQHELWVRPVLESVDDALRWVTSEAMPPKFLYAQSVGKAEEMVLALARAHGRVDQGIGKLLLEYRVAGFGDRLMEEERDRLRDQTDTITGTLQEFADTFRPILASSPPGKLRSVCLEMRDWLRSIS